MDTETAMQTWANLEKVFQLSPRELYENEELEGLHRSSRRDVNRMSKSELRLTLSQYVRDVMLSNESLARGDGWEDVLAFLDWVDGGME